MVIEEIESFIQREIFLNIVKEIAKKRKFSIVHRKGTTYERDTDDVQEFLYTDHYFFLSKGTDLVYYLRLEYSYRDNFFDPQIGGRKYELSELCQVIDSSFLKNGRVNPQLGNVTVLRSFSSKKWGAEGMLKATEEKGTYLCEEDSFGREIFDKIKENF